MMTSIQSSLFKAGLPVFSFFCLSLLTSSLFAQDLFTQVDLENIQLSESQTKVLESHQQSETTIDLRVVEVNVEALMNEQTINLSLLTNESFVTLREKIETRSATDFD